MAIEIFSRKEQKYLITRRQYEELVDRISPKMRNVKNGTEGSYSVTSLYFDSPDKSIYFETKNKLKYRQKLRLRVYDEADLNSTAFFEVKQRHKQVVNKRRMILPLREAYRYLEGDYKEDFSDIETSNPQVMKEIDYFRKYYDLKPEMVVSYSRHALHGVTDPELRITFDFDLKCRKHDLHIENGPYGDYFIDSDLVVLEVKVDHAVPLWLARILQELNCEQRSASKFCTSMELLSSDALPQSGYMEPKELEEPTIGGIENESDHELVFI
ncbi:polyphosphate polymerase domain-containing protein [Sporosarcina aquimarina]|uniref:Polyphosphate polymerase domain-containing protein n=1 Tax=Sporosarcina aquimarina TaxID=114975 RepID=A0ABU4FUS2_9BACL|nr:polyphosphate polymerase domain-containing protein [Sporosarcina aquimarina]MDW0108471.1 polyphosphate polymerase domain-containing protein [Sporosarcina aquimarina]